ncbi:arabinogalactan endo-1,4-beta-galactosidase [Paenibacillus cellulositrophicus]|uniref:glycoside hydrolase family 53 protein n=1 Tax=Paenibacillus cellulositrophicus TaxID=562959 RepID=UPI00204104F1|nr:arabinogalactan endo-1,4-beta-galactosidase [Paenibacillus cellulositrophicus]MCM3000607.1 arabinogalactan endo-1,4-beta-galactosidase [Paenibacillus cellulositrophicus]
MEIEKMWIKGMDVSFLDEIEQGGGTFHEGPDKVDVLELLQRSGTTSIRLRIWNDPPGGYCNLERTLIMAKRVKELGMHLLLDFHYSDKWADPANQWKPAAWEGLHGAALEQAVYDYTYEVMAVLRAGGALPDIVQIGNEITNGMLWPDAKVDPKAESGADEEPWARLCGLLKSGASAVRAVDRSVRVMLHIDRGGDPEGSRTFFERMEAEGVPFDVIGLSYYPWWHGPLEQIERNLQDLSLQFGRDIVVVETAYPWTFRTREGFPLIVENDEALPSAFPVSPEGQQAYLKALTDIIRRTPDGRGLGFYYWEPCWIPSQQVWSVGHANNWSNLTLFDHDGYPLPALYTP